MFNTVLFIMGLCLAYESVDRVWYLLFSGEMDTRDFLKKKDVKNTMKLKYLSLHVRVWLEAIIFAIFSSLCFLFSYNQQVPPTIVYCLAFLYVCHVILHILEDKFLPEGGRG